MEDILLKLVESLEVQLGFASISIGW
jgi:hypothetical protein